jgi:hypothetical protein
MRKLIVLIVAAALLVGCAGSSTTTATTASVSSPPVSSALSGAPPTAEQTARAGKVCTATTTLKKNVEGLASAVTAGGGDISASMSAQISTVKTSATALASTLSAVPAGSVNVPQAAAVTTSADQFKASIAALESSVATLAGKSGMSKVNALASVGSAASSSLSSLGATTAAITTAAKDGKSSLGQAFKTAPSCGVLT